MRRLPLLVSIWFQVYFTTLTGVLFTFPSRYLFTIDLQEYLALPVSSGRFPRAIRVSRYSRTETKEIFDFRLRDYYPLGCYFPKASPNQIFFDSPSRRSGTVSALQPPASILIPIEIGTKNETGFGLLPFRSPLLRK